jgi:hypothetical protein
VVEVVVVMVEAEVVKEMVLVVEVEVVDIPQEWHQLLRN